MFEQAFKNLDVALRQDSGCSTELDIAKLCSALTSKYGGLHEAQKVLGDVDEIRNVFVDFQQHLYAVKVA